MKVFNLGIISFILIIFNSFSTLAWDGKISTGQVLSNNDGEEGVHDFASPSEQAKLMENYAEGGDQVGVFNGNLFIMQDDGIISVPMGEITGVGPEELNQVISDAFVEYEVKIVTKYVEMEPEDLAALDADKLAKVPPKAMAQMGEDQIGAFNPDAMNGMTAKQLGAFQPDQMKHFSPSQLVEMPPETFTEMNIGMVNAVNPEVFEQLSEEQLNNIVIPEMMPGLPPIPSADGFAISLPEINPDLKNILPPENFVQIGTSLDVQIIKIDLENLRIALSLKRLQPEPWEMISSDVSVGTIMKGTITKLASFGAFARVKGGLEGLIHLSELSYDKIDVPSDVVREGQEVEVKIIKIEEERKRLGLSLLLDKEINEPAFESSESEQTNNSSEESSEESPEQKTEESPEENTEENTEESSEESSEEKN